MEGQISPRLALSDLSNAETEVGRQLRFQVN